MSSSTIISPILSYCSMLRPRHSGSMSVGGDVDSIKTKPISIDCSLNEPKRGMWWFGSRGATHLSSDAGGEEAEAVAAAGVDFEIVPGVTAAVAVPAYAGIPVTHRTLASTVTFVTGHEDPTKPATLLDWPKLASASGTLVFMMGMKNLPSIVGHLLSEGRSPDTPVAAIRWGTKADQQTIVGTLGDIVAKAEAAHLEPPTVIVVGEVVRLRGQLNWFESKPLFGKRIVLTRAQEQATRVFSAARRPTAPSRSKFRRFRSCLRSVGRRLMTR